MEKFTKEQAAIIGAYTGFLAGPFSEMAEYAENLLGRPVYTHQYPSVANELRDAAKDDFLSMCRDERYPIPSMQRQEIE